MKKTYITPEVETTRIEIEIMNGLSKVGDGSTATTENEYATEGADALGQGSAIWDDMEN